jgi:hypothetical protein
MNIENKTDANVRQEESTGPDGRQQITLIIEKTVEQGLGSGSVRPGHAEQLRQHSEGHSPVSSPRPGVGESA